MPLNELAEAKRVVGIRAVEKKLLAGMVVKVFLARDARGSLISGLAEEAEKAGVPIEWVESITLLGRACAIDRGAAAAGLVK